MNGARGLILLAVTATAHAHHSPAAYDLGAERVLRGQVTEFEWANPHVYIHLDVPVADGEVERWLIEGNPPASMLREGWTPDSLTAGDRIEISVRPAVLPGRRIAMAVSVIKEDGTVLPPAQPGEPEPGQIRPATSLSGIWHSDSEFGFFARTIGFPGGPEAELTPLGEAAKAAWDERTMNPGILCVQIPPPIYMALPQFLTLEIGEDTTIIRSYLEGVERMIKTNLDSHEGATPSLHGHSIGHWEGDVLVVDTARFAPHATGTVGGVPSGPDKHLVERFELDPDGLTLTYSLELEDPDYLAEAITSSWQWHYRPDLPDVDPEQIPECDLENARYFLED